MFMIERSNASPRHPWHGKTNKVLSLGSVDCKGKAVTGAFGSVACCCHAAAERRISSWFAPRGRRRREHHIRGDL